MATNNDKKSVKASTAKPAAAKKPVAKTTAKTSAKPVEKKPAPVVKPATAVEKPVIITYNGVRYQISRADLEQLQTILSRATVVKDDNAPQVKPAAEPVVAKKESETREKLTDAVVQRLVGHTNVVYYNFETHAWNTDYYNGFRISNKSFNQDVAEFRAAMNREAKFHQQYEFVASITMTIDEESYSGCGIPISYPLYDQRGTAVVGNIIVKNKETGQYELYCKYWVGVRKYLSSKGASGGGAACFTVLGSDRLAGFRVALIEAHTR